MKFFNIVWCGYVLLSYKCSGKINPSPTYIRLQFYVGESWLENIQYPYDALNATYTRVVPTLSVKNV